MGFRRQANSGWRPGPKYAIIPPYMKKFSVPCDFGGTKAPFDFYIGEPKDGNHPLQNQSSWLAANRGGTVPAEVMENFAKILKLAQENGVSFEELCAYAIEANQLKGG